MRELRAIACLQFRKQESLDRYDGLLCRVGAVLVAVRVLGATVGSLGAWVLVPRLGLGCCFKGGCLVPRLGPGRLFRCCVSCCKGGGWIFGCCFGCLVPRSDLWVLCCKGVLWLDICVLFWVLSWL